MLFRSFKKNNCLTIYFDHNKSIPLFWRYSSSEAAEEITGDLYAIKEKSYDAEHKHWWYTHKNLRKVVRHIENALPDMFYYLDDKNIPKTTNGLEGRFNFLKHHLNSHRGLSKSKRKNYFDWYLSTKFISKIK